MLYNFGPGGPAFKAPGSGAWHITPKFELSSPPFLIVLTFILGLVYKMTSWGRHVLAIGGVMSRRPC
jgi:ribose/xylose/arabinose/galactoside ABC-type transport system permease subunit